ncbi:MAG: transporter [Gemmatimonadetes bacterium]|nr:transporter [Gemmatimonadota bacterium]MYC00248.1 transporter [Gemmatimonadota bacterium]
MSGLLAVAVTALGGGADDAVAQWVEEPGKGWIALAAYHQDTRERFGIDGDTRVFFAEGHAVTTSSFLTAALGLVPGFDMWSQFSFHRLRYDDVAGTRSSTGFGDARFWLRAAPLKWLGSAVPFAVRAGFKVPIGDFDVDAEVIPLGDGQRDWEVMAEAGHSFWPRTLYLSGWVGYRWREENPESGKDFGNEVFYFAQAGGRFGRWGWKVAVDGWDGASGVTEGVPVPSFQRDLVQLQPSLLYDVGPGQMEAGVRFALKGRNLPAGTAFMIQYFTRWEPF